MTYQVGVVGTGSSAFWVYGVCWDAGGGAVESVIMKDEPVKAKRWYSMRQCYASQSYANSQLTAAEAAAWYLGASAVTTHSYEAGPRCAECPTEYCFDISWRMDDIELKVTEAGFKEILSKALSIEDNELRGKYLAGIKEILKK